MICGLKSKKKHYALCKIILLLHGKSKETSVTCNKEKKKYKKQTKAVNRSDYTSQQGATINAFTQSVSKSYHVSYEYVSWIVNYVA